MRMPWQRGTATSPGASPSPSPSPSADYVSPALLAWANAVDATSLSHETVEAAERFLREYRRMRTTLAARRQMTFRLRTAIAAQVSPPPPASVHGMDVIATAVSARRRQLGLPADFS